MTKLVDIRCSCGKLLGRVQEGAKFQFKCSRCKEYKISIPNPAYVEIPYQEHLKDGDQFTIAGLKYLENGSIIRNCKPGEETILTARVKA